MKATTMKLDLGLTHSQTAYLTKLLSKNKELLSERVSRLRNSHKVRLSADSSERAVELEDVEVRAELLYEGRRELAAVESALERIKGQHFGVCHGCGKPIGWQRLQAKPHALHCIVCKSQTDNDQ